MTRRYRSNDPASLSHVERRYYVNATVEPGASLRYGSWEESEHHATRCTECYGSGKVSDRSWRDVRCTVCGGSGRVRAVALTVIDAATGSDYSGNLCQISNARCLKRDFPWLVELHGGYSTRGVAYLGKRENQNPALLEAIDALTESCLYDEDDHSTLEHEREAEAWSESYGGRHDWARALAKFLDELDEEHTHEIDEETHRSALDDLWYDCTEKLMGGESSRNESGDSIYFPIDSVIDKIERAWPGIDSPHYHGERPTIREQLNTLCDATRVNEGV